MNDEKEVQEVKEVKDVNMDETKYPPEEADLKERMDMFNKEIWPLCVKYELGLAAIPKVRRDGTLGADPIIVSTRKAVLQSENSPAENTLETPEE